MLNGAHPELLIEAAVPVLRHSPSSAAPILGRSVDLIDYGVLRARVDHDIRRDAVLL